MTLVVYLSVISPITLKTMLADIYQCRDEGLVPDDLDWREARDAVMEHVGTLATVARNQFLMAVVEGQWTS